MNLLQWVILFAGAGGDSVPQIDPVIDCGALFSGPSAGRNVSSCLSGDPTTGANVSACLTTTETAGTFGTCNLFPSE